MSSWFFITSNSTHLTPPSPPSIQLAPYYTGLKLVHTWKYCLKLPDIQPAVNEKVSHANVNKHNGFIYCNYILLRRWLFWGLVIVSSCQTLKISTYFSKYWMWQFSQFSKIRSYMHSSAYLCNYTFCLLINIQACMKTTSQKLLYMSSFSPK